MWDGSIFDFMKVYLVMYNHDQYRNGHVSVMYNWSRKPTCPVQDNRKKIVSAA